MKERQRRTLTANEFMATAMHQILSGWTKRLSRHGMRLVGPDDMFPSPFIGALAVQYLDY
jgi:hypothetical protein